MTELLSIKAVAEILGVSEHTVRREVKDRKITYEVIRGQKRIHVNDLDNYRRDNRVRAKRRMPF